MRLSTFSTKLRYSLSVDMKRVRSAPSMRLASSPWRTTIPSEARFTITFTNSRSSLMYCSKLLFRSEARKVGAFNAAGFLAMAHHHSFRGPLHHHLHKLAVVLDVLLETALLDLVKRRRRK